MPSKLVVVLLVSSVVWELIVCEEEISSCCLVPPQPRHGMYTFSHKSERNCEGYDYPNDFKLTITCDPGYQLVGVQNVSCLAGHWFDEMPECLPECKKEKLPSVVRCTNEGRDPECRCVLDQQLINLGNLRALDSNKEDNYPCGTETIGYAKAIAGGRPTEGRELPWHAAIYTKATRPYLQICGGTLVSKNAVVSAAHCFWSEISQRLMPKENYAVGLGKLYRPWMEDKDTAQKFDVSDIRVPPRYQGSATRFQDDIAVLILQGDVTYGDAVKPICLSFDPAFDAEQLKPGSLGKTAGWGLTSEDGDASPRLLLAELPYVDVATCFAELPHSFKPFITSDKICAGYINGTSVCKGDSGGGLVFKDGRQNYLRGITSTAPGSDHLCNVYTRAMFTHIQRHEEFIKKYVDFQEPKRGKEKKSACV